MKYFLLDPEVAGGKAEDTVVSRSVFPPRVSKLHYRFDGWLGDDLLTSFPCFIVTERLAEAIKNAGLSGVEFKDVKITKSEEFEHFFPNKELPPFVWLDVIGKPGHDDFGALEKDATLVVSDQALRLLRTFHLKQCGVRTYRHKPRGTS